VIPWVLSSLIPLEQLEDTERPIVGLVALVLVLAFGLNRRRIARAASGAPEISTG
jgi:hypothetical protein